MMLKICVLRAAAAAILWLGVADGTAAPLREGRIVSFVHEVSLLSALDPKPRPASSGAMLDARVSVVSGPQSRAEITYADRTLVRIGAHTSFSVEPGTRNLLLDRGTMLLQVAGGASSTRVRAGGSSAVLSGTVLLEYSPGHHLKVLVLQGSSRIFLHGRLGQSIVLEPGKLLILGASEKQIPVPVAVDLTTIVKTSALVDAHLFSVGAKVPAQPLATIPAIERQIALQARAKSKARLVETNLLIKGDGTAVVVLPKETTPVSMVNGDPGAAAAAENSQIENSGPASPPAPSLNQE